MRDKSSSTSRLDPLIEIMTRQEKHEKHILEMPYGDTKNQTTTVSETGEDQNLASKLTEKQNINAEK